MPDTKTKLAHALRERLTFSLVSQIFQISEQELKQTLLCRAELSAIILSQTKSYLPMAKHKR